MKLDKLIPEFTWKSKHLGYHWKKKSKERGLALPGIRVMMNLKTSSLCYWNRYKKNWKWKIELRDRLMDISSFYTRQKWHSRSVGKEGTIQHRELKNWFLTGGKVTAFQPHTIHKVNSGFITT